MPANRFETLATWYLRFNGYFTAPDFTVHPDFKKQPGGTDADVLAVRFPYSEEYQRRFNFDRDGELVRRDRTDFVIAEVKTGMCDINPNSWRDRARQNVEYAIRWMGFTPSDECVQVLANEIYDKGHCDIPESRTCVRFVCFGSKENDLLRKELPLVQQILHAHVFAFLRERFALGCCGINRTNWDGDIAQFAALCGAATEDELMTWASSLAETPKPSS